MSKHVFIQKNKQQVTNAELTEVHNLITESMDSGSAGVILVDLDCLQDLHHPIDIANIFAEGRKLGIRLIAVGKDLPNDLRDNIGIITNIPERPLSKRLLVVGEPGSGKSHLVRYQTDELKEQGIEFDRIVLIDPFLRESEKEGVQDNTLFLEDLAELDISKLTESDLVVFDHIPERHVNLVFETMLRLRKVNVSSIFVTQPDEKIIGQFSKICDPIISCKYENGEFFRYVLYKR